MRRTLLVLAALALPAHAQVQNAREDTPAVIVTGTPLGSGLFEFVSPADVLAGQRLAERRAASLGETLDGLPGVASTYFGPAASRPVIRGLDADRIRVLQNGTGTLDASSLSFDHAVPYDPIAAERVEVVRGPAAVLYGGSAVGGVVNVIDNRIPAVPVKGVSGRGEARHGGAGQEHSLGALLEAGNGQFSLHADVLDRRSQNLKIPGFARSARQRALDGPGVAQARGRLANSNADAEGGSLGGSFDWGQGYAGISFQGYRANYGSIPEPDVRVDMKSERWDLAGEARDLGSLITGVKVKLGRTDYEHRELELGAVNTTFRNKGSDGRIELTHGRLGPLTGTFGLHFTDFDFSALGAEAFVPKTSTDAKALFLYEELALGDWKLSFGGRGEHARIASEGGGRFDPPQSRSYSPRSVAFGALYNVSKQLALAANLTRTERAPGFYELYANGPHAATGVFEIGNPTFANERSKAWDLGVRWRSGPHSAGVTVFRSRFDNFIAQFASGNRRGADGELNPVDGDGDDVADGSGEEILPESVYRAVPARFNGVEAQARWRLLEARGTLDLELRADRVRATDRLTGNPLPRIAPARFGAALDWGLGPWSLRADLMRASAQNRVDPNERPTDGYTLVNLFAGYRFKLQDASLQAFLRITNLLDKEARLHSSFLKDQAPLGARAVLVGVRGSF